MKRSHLQTPRTLAECEFTCGYPIDNPNEVSARRADVFLVIVCVLAVGLILLGVI